MPYAAGTDVPVERSKAEIERLLTYYKAEQFAYMRDATKTIIAFRMFGRAMKLEVWNPGPKEKDIAMSPSGRERTPAQIESAIAQETRRRWRGLLLMLKAKIEAIHTGIATPEDEFLAYTLLADGRTVGEWAATDGKKALESGRMPASRLLGAGS